MVLVCKVERTNLVCGFMVKRTTRERNRNSIGLAGWHVGGPRINHGERKQGKYKYKYMPIGMLWWGAGGEQE